MLENFRHAAQDECVKNHASTIAEFIAQTPTPWRSAPVDYDASPPHPRGHITASAWVLNHTLERAALLHHKKLNLWLQPGGHVEEGDASWFDAALREVREETGLTKLALTPRWQDELFDVDVHDIPARPAKENRAAEPAHRHFDVRFVFVADANEALTVNWDESAGLKWFALRAIVNDHALDVSVRRMAAVALRFAAESAPNLGGAR
jgi:8-oxo-dGTP pyrophosphatase MutT (NUDIX family)